jgi:hypothetical protein
MENFVAVRDVVNRLIEAGDGRKPATLRVFVIRAIHSRSLPGAEKVGPATGMWLIPADSVDRWLEGRHAES